MNKIRQILGESTSGSNTFHGRGDFELPVPLMLPPRLLPHHTQFFTDVKVISNFTLYLEVKAEEKSSTRHLQY